MLGGMSVCKLCPGDLARQVVATSAGRSGNCRRISAPCIFLHLSSSVFASSSSFGRQACPMRVTPYLGSSLGVERRGAVNRINLFYGAPNSRAGEHKFDFGYTLSFTSLLRRVTLSSRKNLTKRLHCKAEARLSDVSKAAPVAVGRSLSDKFREIASDTSEAGSRDVSSSISSPSSLSEGSLPVNLAAGVGVTAAVFMMAVLGFVAKPRTNGGGSVSDLIRRGQLRSDRGGTDSKNLMYDDPFNNPLVKMGNKNPIVKMCGKMFRLAPVTLTDEKVAKHQNRRIQAYKWKRPIVFLNEGDPVPEGIDSEEVRWIPSNHPFATTSNFIDEDLAQKNIYQTRGVPSRVRAEHEALRKKIYETAQGDSEYQLPSMENSGAQAWKTVEDTSRKFDILARDEGQESDSAVTFGKQVNGNGGNTPESGGGQGGTRNGVSESRYRTIDFSGEEQGSGRT